MKNNIIEGKNENFRRNNYSVPELRILRVSIVDIIRTSLEKGEFVLKGYNDNSWF